MSIESGGVTAPAGGLLSGIRSLRILRAEALAADNVALIEARGGAYVLRDPANGGAVVRSGRTINLNQREAQHLRDPALKDFEFDPVYRTDIYSEQRGLEQILHDAYQPPLNKIRPISLNNENYDMYMEAARKYLGN